MIRQTLSSEILYDQHLKSGQKRLQNENAGGKVKELPPFLSVPATPGDNGLFATDRIPSITKHDTLLG